MASREKLNWSVPSDVWDRFAEHCKREYGAIDGYAGREVEMALREYADADPYGEELEELVTRLLNATGQNRRPRGKKNVAGFDSDDKKTVHVRVDPNLKDRAKKQAKEAGVPYGEYLARAIEERREGGRNRRLVDKLERVVEQGADVLEAINGDVSDMTSREKRTVAICDELGREFSRSELHDAIRKVAGDSQHTLDIYTDRVTDRKGVVPHKNNQDLFVQEGGPDAPDPDALDAEIWAWNDLSPDAKVRAARIAAIQESTRGKGQLTTDEIRQVFDGHVPASSAREVRDRASNAPGFRVRERPETNGKALAVRVDEAPIELVEFADDRPSLIGESPEAP